MDKERERKRNRRHKSKNNQNTETIVSPRKKVTKDVIHPRISRRLFLQGAGVTFGLAAAGAVLKDMFRPREFGEGYEYRHLPTSSELLGTIDELPDGLIKSLLVSRIKPLFSNNPPQTIDIDGTPINIRKVN